MSLSHGSSGGEYGPRPTTPQPYRRYSSVRRRVITHWLGVGDAWPPVTGRADLVVVQGVARSPGELEAWKERQRNLPSAPQLLIGIPTLASALDPQACSAKKAGRDYFSFANFSWYLGGVPFTPPSGSSRAQHLTQALRSLYRCSPGPFPAGLNSWLQVVQALLHNRGHLKILSSRLKESRRSLAPFHRTVLSFFVQTGILVGVDSGLGWTELRLSGEFGDVPGGGGSTGWLSFLLEALYGKDGAQGVPLEDLFRQLARPPYGVRGSVARHLVAIAASCHMGSLWYESPERSFAIAEDQLLALLEKPVGKLVFRPASPSEQLFLRSLRQLFRPLVETRGDLALDPWEQTRKDILHWHAELPAWTRVHRHSHTPQAQALLRVCEEAQSLASKPLFRTTLPEAFRWKEIPSPAEQAYFIDQINVARLELEGFLRRFLDKLALGVYSTLVGGEVELSACREWLLRGRRAWIGGFLAGTFEGSGFSPWAEGLLTALSGPSAFGLDTGGGGDVELEERWFVQLPRDLGLSPVREWERDQSRLFLARLGRARLELELGRFQEHFSAFSGPRKVEALRGWMHLVLSGDDVPAEVAEEILALVLDDLE